MACIEAHGLRKAYGATVALAARNVEKLDAVAGRVLRGA